MRLLNFRYFYMIFATLYVIFCNMVFVGQDNFKHLVFYTIIALSGCLIMRLLYGFSKLMFLIFFWVYFAFVVGSFAYEIFSAGVFQHFVAGYITIGFMILLSILGSGAIEIILLFVGSISLLAGGIWLSRTQPNFDLYLTISLLSGILLLTLSVFRIDIFNARDVNRSKPNKHNTRTPIKGNFANISILSTISYVFLLTLSIAAILFTLLPRPMLKSTSESLFPEEDLDLASLAKYLKPEFEDYPSALDQPEAQNPDFEAPEETREVNLRWSFLSSLLDKKPRFYVEFSKFGTPGRRVHNDDFYTKIKVFDIYNGDKWLVSPYSQNAWSNTHNQDYVFPLMYEILEGRQDTRGGVLANAALIGNIEDNKVSAFYELIEKQKYTYLFVPDFPLSLEMTNFRINENTGELKSNFKNPKEYKIETYNVNYDRLRATVCSAGKGKTNSRMLTVGDFDIDLSELAVKIINDAKNDPNFMEFASEKFTDHDKVRAIVNYLKIGFEKHEFTYEITPPRVPEGMNSLKYFLFNTKIGNCTQFNTAAAVLLRYLGIPTRVVAGYRGGRWIEKDKRYEVPYLHAHLWFEVYFKNFGWYRFDATPQVEREQLINQVENDTYTIPQYKKSDITPTPELEKVDPALKKDDKPEVPEDALTNEDEKTENKEEKLVFGRFLTDYDNDAMIQNLIDFARYVFTSGIRISILILVIILIPMVYFHKNVTKFAKRWLKIFKGSGKDNSEDNMRRSRKSRIIENRLIADFRDLEKLLRRLGFTRKRSETWQEFNSRLNLNSPLITTMLSSLVVTYYYARFGMNYSEFEDFQEQMGSLKKQLQQQLKTQT